MSSRAIPAHLNLADMAPAVALVDANGRVLERTRLDARYHHGTEVSDDLEFISKARLGARRGR